MPAGMCSVGMRSLAHVTMGDKWSKCVIFATIINVTLVPLHLLIRVITLANVAAKDISADVWVKLVIHVVLAILFQLFVLNGVRCSCLQLPYHIVHAPEQPVNVEKKLRRIETSPNTSGSCHVTAKSSRTLNSSFRARGFTTNARGTTRTDCSIPGYA